MVLLYLLIKTLGIRGTYRIRQNFQVGKTSVIVHKIHYSLENFYGASGRGHHVLYTARDSRGKLLRSPEKTSHALESFALYGIYNMQSISSLSS